MPPKHNTDSVEPRSQTAGRPLQLQRGLGILPSINSARRRWKPVVSAVSLLIPLERIDLIQIALPISIRSCGIPCVMLDATTPEIVQLLYRESTEFLDQVSNNDLFNLRGRRII